MNSVRLNPYASSPGHHHGGWMRRIAPAVVVLAALVAAAPVATKWVGPLIMLPGGGSTQTTIYYGPWQCRPVWLEACGPKCAAEGRKSMGCIWLADIKTDLKTRFLLMPISWGGKLAITHCCCDWPLTRPTERAKWDRSRESFRDQWAREFGSWPDDGSRPWDGHHIRDLAHGGDPISQDNLLPTPRDIHDRYGVVYPQCYAGNGQWAQPGPEYPYAE